MINPEKLISINSPSSKPFLTCNRNDVTLLNNNNVIYYNDILTSEAELAIYLKNTVFPKLNQQQSNTLLELINKYEEDIIDHSK